MKTTLITRQDRKQIVLAPETPFEENILKMFGDGYKQAKIFLGNFSDCQGGFTREYNEQNNLIVVFDEGKETKEIL